MFLKNYNYTITHKWKKKYSICCFKLIESNYINVLKSLNLFMVQHVQLVDGRLNYCVIYLTGNSSVVMSCWSSLWIFCHQNKKSAQTSEKYRCGFQRLDDVRRIRHYRNSQRERIITLVDRRSCVVWCSDWIQARRLVFGGLKFTLRGSYRICSNIRAHSSQLPTSRE